MIDARRDDLFKIAMNYAHWKVNPRIVRAFIDKSGDTIRWLEEKGLNFDVVPLYPNQVPLTWHCPKGYGAQLIKVLAVREKEMAAEEKLIRRKLGLLELAEYLSNVSEACRIQEYPVFQS